MQIKKQSKGSRAGEVLSADIGPKVWTAQGHDNKTPKETKQKILALRFRKNGCRLWILPIVGLASQLWGSPLKAAGARLNVS